MIEKLKFLSITGPKEDIDRLVLTYLSKYEIHLENALTELSDVHSLTPFVEMNPYKNEVKSIGEYYDALPNKESYTPAVIETKEAIGILRRIGKSLKALQNEQDALQKEHDEILEPLKTFRFFKNIDFDISSLLNFQYIRCRFGRINKLYYEKFERYIYDNGDTLFLKSEEDEEYVYGIYFVPQTRAKKIHAVYSSMHFERIYIPAAYEGSIKETWEKLEQRHGELHQQLLKNKENIQNFLSENAQDIVNAKQAIEFAHDCFDIRKMAACTKGEKEVYYFLCGWMSLEDTTAFLKDIEGDEKVYCLVNDDIPNDGLEPPTKLKNPKIFKPYEMYIKMYGLPAYNEIDPTLFIALTYSFIFGAMFGDAGQGLLLMIGGFLLYRFKKIDLAGIIACAGVFSTFFGIMFGSFFGFENLFRATWLRPKEAMLTIPFVGTLNTVFVVAIAFGMFLLLACMIINIINAVREKDVEGTWFTNNSIAGFVFYAALVLCIFLYMTGHALPGTFVLVLMFGIPLLVIFFKEPLTNLVLKKSKLMPQGGVGMFFVQGFFEMFEVLLSYFSNTLSFVRIGAFAVSHAAMMEVVLQLAGYTEGGGCNWVVIVIGNLFVCGLEGLIVGIQVLRLEYYEFFSRFYKGTGHAFVPFKLGRHK